MQDAAAAAVASGHQPYRASTSPNQASGEASSSGGSRGIGGVGGASFNVRGSNIRPQHAASFKGTANSPSSAMLGPIVPQTLPQASTLGPPPASSDIAVKSGKRAQRSSSVGMSSLEVEAPLTRSGKPGLDPRAQGKSWQALASAASLPASGLKGSFQTSKAGGARVESPLQGLGSTPPVFILASQPSQPVQTVQQLLAEMQAEKRARESLGGRQSPRSPCWGATAVTDSVGAVGEGRARLVGNSPAGSGAQEGRCPMESPFAESLSSAKPLAISRRYAMAGTSELCSAPLSILLSTVLCFIIATRPCPCIVSISCPTFCFYHSCQESFWLSGCVCDAVQLTMHHDRSVASMASLLVTTQPASACDICRVGVCHVYALSEGTLCGLFESVSL